MSTGAWMMVIALAIALAALAFLIFATIRSIQVNRSGDRGIWREFSLGLALMLLFFGTWLAHGISQWQTYTDQQREHNQPVEAGDFVAEFSQSTLENWQSEFLQLFSFVVLAALYIHKGSAESKDTEEKIEASLRRIETKLETLPADAPMTPDEIWQLPDTPLRFADGDVDLRARREQYDPDASSSPRSGRSGPTRSGAPR
jgi:hypothetical protein